jgi:hypothetical protein
MLHIATSVVFKGFQGGKVLKIILLVGNMIYVKILFMISDLTNKKRLLEVDFVKSFAIIFMMLVHIFEMFAVHPLQTGTLNYIIRLFGAPFVAPMFMVSMGIGIVYSKDCTPRKLFKRGIMIFSIGYLLQFVRDFLPLNLLGMMYSDPSYSHEGLLLLLSLDILIFAGLYFMFFSFYQKSNLKKYWLIIFWAIFASLNSLLSGINYENLWMKLLSGYLWGSWSNTWFPFFSWYIFPTLGYFLGGFIINLKEDDKDTFFQKLFIVSALLFVIACYLFKNVDFGIQSAFWLKYFQQGWQGNIVYGLFSLLWLSVNYFLVKNFSDKAKSIITYLGRNLTKIYLIHWVILGWLIIIFPTKSQNLITVIMIWLFVFSSSLFLSSKCTGEK